MRAASRVPTVSGRLALPLVARWRRRGGDTAALLRPLGLDESELRRFDARVALERWSALHGACTHESGEPAFALDAVAQLERGDFPLELQLVSSQPTLHEGLRFVQPYSRTSVDGLEVELWPRGERSLAIFHVDGQPLGPPAFAEYFLALLWAFSGAVAPGSRPPTAVRFCHRWARHGTAALEGLFAAPVRFGEAQVGFELALHNLDVPIPNADPELGRVLASSAATILAASTTALRLRDRARHWLAEHLVGERPLAARLAEAMHVSERTLRRRLREEGTGLRGLVDDARREQALALLEQGRWSVERVALELGFSSATAFGRAFKKWMGRSPADFSARPNLAGRTMRMP